MHMAAFLSWWLDGYVFTVFYKTVQLDTFLMRVETSKDIATSYRPALGYLLYKVLGDFIAIPGEVKRTYDLDP